MLYIVNGKVADPVTGTNDYLDLAIDDGKIVKMTIGGAMPEPAESDRVIDAKGMIIAPGFCDVHVHFRDPGFTYKEDILTGAKAAARGGYTDVVMMANTKPAIDNVETLDYVLKKGAETGIHVHACGSVTKDLKGAELTDMKELLSKGAVGFTDDGIPLMDKDLLHDAFVTAAGLDVPVSLHEEDKTLIKENGINHGAASDYYDLFGSPREAEYKLIARDIKIALDAGVKLNIQHISTREGVELVRKARKHSDRIYAEVTPHHIALTESALIEYGANAKMNPPLRTKRDRSAIIEGIKDGTISIIATDHAPHSTEEKEKGITAAPSGIIGLESAFSVAYENLVKSGAITLNRLIEMLSVNPRKLYGFDTPGIREGAPADLAIFSEKEKWLYDSSVSKAVNTPFLGRILTGKIKYTICGGKIVYEDM